MPENDILIKIRADVKDIKNKLNKMDADFKGASKGIQKETKKMNTGFATLKKILIGAFSVALLYKFKQGMQECIKATSNLEEQTAKFGTVFTGVIDKANKAVGVLTKLYGMSTREARQHMAAIQDLLVPMGMMRGEAADLSFEIVKLATDMGSFNNLPTEITMDKIKSALVGMYRPLRDVGVVLSAATVEQRALNMGLAESKDKLTVVDKALAAYRMTVEYSKDATGDFIRTSEGFANSMKILNARLEDLRVAMGEKLMKVLADDFIPILIDDLIPAIEATVVPLGDFITKLYSIGDAIGDVIDKEKGITDSSIEFTKKRIASIEREIRAVGTMAGSKGYGWARREIQGLNKDKEKAIEVLEKLIQKQSGAYSMTQSFTEEIRIVSGEMQVYGWNTGEAADETERLKDEVRELTEEQTIQIQSLLDLAAAQLAMPEVKIPTLYEVNIEMQGLIDNTIREGEVVRDANAATNEYMLTLEGIPSVLLEWEGGLKETEKGITEAQLAMIQFGQAAGQTFGNAIREGKQFDDVLKSLMASAIQLALSFIPGVGPIFSGIFGGLLGAPAPGQAGRGSYAGQVITTGQIKEAATLSKPMYGRRYLEESAKQGFNIESISAWSLE